MSSTPLCRGCSRVSGVKFSRGFQGGNHFGFRAKKRSLILACAFFRHLKKNKKKSSRVRAHVGASYRDSVSRSRRRPADLSYRSGPFLLRSGQRHPVISSLSLLVVMERAGSTGSVFGQLAMSCEANRFKMLGCGRALRRRFQQAGSVSCPQLLGAGGFPP